MFFSRQKEYQSMVANYNDLKGRCETAEHQVKVNSNSFLNDHQGEKWCEFG